MIDWKPAPGQRVYVPSEPQLGLGTIAERSGRRLFVHFPRTDEERTYSVGSEAVVRYRPQSGDLLLLQDGTREAVVGVEEVQGLWEFECSSGLKVTEADLHFDSELSDPFGDLALGRIGSPADFIRRRSALALRSFGRSQPRRGLGSARVELLPHQLYVSERVATMWRPRVLLADEVGLGKTIEAGLIAVRMAALERVSSILVVAPRALTGQWLAEFYRRFARPLNLFDPEAEEHPQDLLVATEDLDDVPRNLIRDLLVVDEAHRCTGRPVANLAARSRAVLLLTATPSLGDEEGLFRLLNLLDPIRYRDLRRLEDSAQEWKMVAEFGRRLEADESSTELEERLVHLFPNQGDLLGLLRDGRRTEVAERLADRHGLGRSLIRNRRGRLGSLFPGRALRRSPYEGEAERQTGVLQQLQSLAADGKKALLMVRTPEQVRQWWDLIKRETRLRVARFDETMSLLERDRQAAWFNRTSSAAGVEAGADILVCSEIGGEGRNFQVAHHLFLLDLPRHPERLEQRIGRLDRIGQRTEVQVHVPIATDHQASVVRLDWLDQGLGAFERPLTESETLFQRFLPELEFWEGKGPQEGFSDWCKAVREVVEEHRRAAEESVDPLVDRLSFNDQAGQALCDAVREEQHHLCQLLTKEFPDLVDSLGVTFESTDDPEIFLMKPGDMMFVDALPGLSEGGTLVTFARRTANSREEVEFLHFEHRLVHGVLDVLLDEGVGRATAARWKGAPKTTVLFQVLFVLEAVNAGALGVERILPGQSVLISVDLEGQVLFECALPGHGPVDERSLERLPGEVVEVLLQRTRALRESLDLRLEKNLQEVKAEVLKRALTQASDFFQGEQDRLEHLLELEGEDPEVTGLLQESMASLQEQRKAVYSAIEEARFRFDSVRMILCQE